jgi:hypothetical protein
MTMMRMLSIAATAAFTLAIVPAIASAQVPAQIPVQGVLTDSAGVPLDGPQAIRFRIYAQPTGGAALHDESSSVPIAEGVFTAYLGTDTPLPLTVFDGAPRYLGLAVGTDPEMTPRFALGSVPYAAHGGACDSAELLGTLAPADVQRDVTGSCNTGESIRVINDNGSVVCEPDTDTTYSAGTGLALAGTTLSVDPAALNGPTPATRSTGPGSAVTSGSYVTQGNTQVVAPANVGGIVVAIGTASFVDATAGSGGIGMSLGLDTDTTGTPSITQGLTVPDLTIGTATVFGTFAVAPGSTTTIYLRAAGDTGESASPGGASVMAWFIPAS